MNRKMNMEKNGLFQRIQKVLGIGQEPRLWLREAEVKELLFRASRDYQLTYLKKEGIWRSSTGYFRLWEGLDGAKALVFGFHYGDLDAYGYGGMQLPAHHRKTYLAASWKKDEHVTLGDIINSADAYTERLNRAIADVGVLYETDHDKKLWRSGYTFYKMNGGEESKQAIKGIDFGWDFDDEKLANPYGKNILERAMRAFESRFRIDLLAQDARKRKMEPAAPLKEDEAETFIASHFESTLDGALSGQHPVQAEDRRLNRAYFATAGAAQTLLGFLFNSRKNRLPINAKAAGEASQTIRTSSNFVQALLARFPPAMIGIAGATLAFSLFGYALRWHKARQQERQAQSALSWASRYEGTLGTLLRVVNPEVFSYGNLLRRPTFDTIPPMGIKTVDSLENWPLDLLEPSTGLRLASRVRFHMPAGTAPSLHPKKDVAVIEMQRADGIRKFKFLEDGRIWISYDPRDRKNPRVPAPPQALLAHIRSGHVLEITPSREVGAPPALRQLPNLRAVAEFEKAYGVHLNGAFGRDAWHPETVPQKAVVQKAVVMKRVSAAPGLVASKPAAKAISPLPFSVLSDRAQVELFERKMDRPPVLVRPSDTEGLSRDDVRGRAAPNAARDYAA
jgi:hypothetical protein